MKRMKVKQCLIRGGKQFRQVYCEEAWISGNWIEHGGLFYVPTTPTIKENKPYQEALSSYYGADDAPLLDGYYTLTRTDKEWRMKPE